MRLIVAVRLGSVISTLFLILLITSSPARIPNVTSKHIFVEELPVASSATPSHPQFKCALPQACPFSHFAFHIKSGVANMLGPRICFDGQMIMSGVINNIGVGLNIVLVNGETGKIEKSESFSGDQEKLLSFLRGAKPGNIILVASFDDPATQLTDDIRKAFSSMGSSLIKMLKFRDSWVFAGAVRKKGKSPFEKLLKNDEKTNIFDGWPGTEEISGCYPKNI
ncbi:hypothetical protein AAFF_G00235150 [Aldrovandia affinis]|uniref:ILEI/PANDER domain-containing protein n=1 Tax=Aldrovandia affinis TaxID=143900 RepID=A0AAD7WU41_9TELE|nr:hypothetical protein AAFF_G00235150 [Aldrovandia affinis]